MSESLRRLAATLDHDLGPVDDAPAGESASLVRVTRSGECAVRSLDGEHPYDALLGFVAPDDWEILGVAAPGWGTYYEGPRRGERRRCRAIHLATRKGDEVSLLRFAGDEEGELMPEGNAPGRVADCVRRALDLPTPEQPAESLAAAIWDEFARYAVTSLERPVDVDAVSDIFEATPKSWEEWRWWAIQNGGNHVMDASVATWMDAGMFAREMLAAMEDPDESMARLKAVCTPAAWQSVIVQFLEAAPSALGSEA